MRFLSPLVCFFGSLLFVCRWHEIAVRGGAAVDLGAVEACVEVLSHMSVSACGPFPASNDRPRFAILVGFREWSRLVSGLCDDRKWCGKPRTFASLLNSRSFRIETRKRTEFRVRNEMKIASLSLGGKVTSDTRLRSARRRGADCDKKTFFPLKTRSIEVCVRARVCWRTRPSETAKK